LVKSQWHSVVASLRWRWLLPEAALLALFHFSPPADAFNRSFYDAASR